MKRLFKWFLMLNKRLYKKPVFIAILLLIPICVSALVFASGKQSGFVKIVLAQEDNKDQFSTSLIQDFLDESSLINFSVADTPDKALSDVKTGKADVAWIFPDDMQQKINEFTHSKSPSDAIVDVIIREKNVFTQITQEKLTAVIFRHCAKAQYIDYVRMNVTELDSISDSELSQIYDDVSINADLFDIESVSGAKSDEADSNYLTAPIRGLLAILISICAMAATLFYMQDENRGTFSLVKDSLKPTVAFACILIAAINVSAVVLVALFITNLSFGFLNELLCIIAYSVCCSIFCLFLKQIFPNIKLYATLIPILVVAMTAICPVFAGVKKIWYLFPATYYLNSLYNKKYLLYMMIYSVVLIGIAFCLQKNKRFVKK